MRQIPFALLVLVAASAAQAAELDVQSTIDAVTVYPDGATVTRVIRVDLPPGDSVLRARDFPPGLDPTSLRVEGEGGARLTIGAIDARPPRAERPPVVAGAGEAGRGAARTSAACSTTGSPPPRAQKKFAQRFADSAPAASAKRARRDRCPNGARPSPPSPRRSPPPTADPRGQAAPARDRPRARPARGRDEGQSAAQDGSAHRSRRRRGDAARHCASPTPCAARAGCRSTTRGSTPAPRTASRRSSSSAAPRSCSTPARTGAMSRSRSRPCAPPRAATRRNCGR